MNCEHCERKLADFAVHRLDPKIASAVQSHLARCGPCRELLERVHVLYGVPEPFAAAPPAALRLPLTEESERLARRPLRRVAAALLGVAAAALVLWIGLGRARPSAPQRSPAVVTALTPIRVALPELPGPFEPGKWHDSREEALLLAAYTGRPVLEEYVWKGCPRCKSMEYELQPAYLPILGDFVLYRQLADKGLPAEVEATHPALPQEISYPAIRITEPGCATKPVWEVGNLRTVEDVVADYFATCFLPSEDERAPLDAGLYDWALATLRAVPALVEDGRYAEAFEHIEEARRLEEAYRTRFADDARTLERSLTGALERRVQELEAMADGPDEARARARSLACKLSEQVGDMPIRARVVALCGG